MKQNLRRILAAIIIASAAAVYANAEVLQEIVVKDGDTLWSVANYYLKDPRLWPEILKFNSLPSSDPNVILPGMKLRVPILLIKENLRAAHLIYLLNDVRYRRHTEAEWKAARENMELNNEDGLRTLQLSRAKVKFSSGEILALEENSFIILRPDKKREEIDLLSGGVRASKTKVLAAGSMVNPRIEPRGPAPDFRTKVKEDKTTLVEVYEGVVDVEAQGKTVTLTRGFGTEVKFSQPPSLPHALPPQPDMKMEGLNSIPGTNLTTSGKVTSSTLELAIKAPVTGTSKNDNKDESQSRMIGQIITKYHLQFSTAASFGAVVLDEIDKLSERVSIDFKKYKLPDGTYYYRFAYMDELGFEGQFSPPVQFIIDSTPPRLDVTTPENEQEIYDEFINVEGISEPQVSLKANDKKVDVDDAGKFITAIMPRNGPNLITLIAQDKAGNVTKKELVINKSKYSRKDIGGQPSVARERGLTLASIALGTLTAAVIIGVLILIIH